MSEARKGRVPWNKGKKLGPRKTPRKLSDQARKNISEGCKGRIPWNKGLRINPKTGKLERPPFDQNTDV